MDYKINMKKKATNARIILFCKKSIEHFISVAKKKARRKTGFMLAIIKSTFHLTAPLQHSYLCSHP